MGMEVHCRRHQPALSATALTRTLYCASRDNVNGDYKGIYCCHTAAGWKRGRARDGQRGGRNQLSHKATSVKIYPVSGRKGRARSPEAAQGFRGAGQAPAWPWRAARGCSKLPVSPHPALREELGTERAADGSRKKTPLLRVEKRDLHTAAGAVLLLIVFTRG